MALGVCEALGSFVRALTEAEKSLSREAFGAAIDLATVRLIGWPFRRAFVAGRWFGRDWIVWPQAQLVADFTAAPVRMQGVLIHELTHVWQYQRFGWIYLARTLSVQLRSGREGYRYTLESGRRLADYNLEQQGDIARDYYCALKLGRNCTRTASRDPAAWEALVAEFRAPPGAQ